MIHLFMSILSSASIALILRHNAGHRASTLQLLAANYLMASLVALIRIVYSPDPQIFTSFSMVYGAGLGALFAASFFIFARAVNAAGTAMATTASRISVIIPVLLSVLLFGELPTRWQYAGFGLTILTIIFFYYSVRSMKHSGLHFRDHFFLGSVTLFMGLGDFSMKVYQSLRDSSEEGWMIFFIFFTALIYVLFLIGYRRQKLDRRAVINGLVLGVPNMFSTYFLLGALASLPAVLVYPFNNIGIIILTTAAARLIWKEYLNSWARIALFSGMAALVFLGIN